MYENTRLVAIIYQNIPSPRWNGKWCKILKLSLETRMLILFLFLLSPSFFITLLDNLIVWKLYQSLDDKNVLFAAIKLFWMTEEGLVQQNPKKHTFIEQEKIRKRCKELVKEIWKFQVNKTNFDSLFQASKTQHEGVLIIWECKVINNYSWTLYKNVLWSKVSSFRLRFKWKKWIFDI